MPCYRCGRVQTDPVKGASPWAVAVRQREQVLVCPDCQQEHPSWVDELDRCPRCDSTRLRIQVGLVVCRQCGNDWAAE
ncbi:MAG TPA: hypothetical protein VG929_06740 [Actinomycetota bacterium]|nr:hypothetical protein [Actinomycetota bacterium]